MLCLASRWLRHFWCGWVDSSRCASIFVVMHSTCQAYSMSVVESIAKGVSQGCACLVWQGLYVFVRGIAAALRVHWPDFLCMCSLQLCTSSSAGLTAGLCLCNSCSHNFPPP